MAGGFLGVESLYKGFIKDVQSLSGSRMVYEVWTDFLTLSAIAIANTVEPMEEREEQYKKTIGKYKPEEQALFPKLFTEYTELVEEHPYNDILGTVYMLLMMGDKNHGQVFTPDSLSRLTAKMAISPKSVEIQKEIDERGYVTLLEPSIGGGGMFVNAAGVLKEVGINYQRQALFVGQELIESTAMQAYIQLSLIGCPGFIYVGDTLSDPVHCDLLFPPEKHSKYWKMPMFFSDVWNARRALQIVKAGAVKHE